MTLEALECFTGAAKPISTIPSPDKESWAGTTSILDGYIHCHVGRTYFEFYWVVLLTKTMHALDGRPGGLTMFGHLHARILLSEAASRH